MQDEQAAASPLHSRKAPSLLRIVVAVALAMAFGTISYAAVRTVDAVPATSVIVASLALVVVIILLALGWLNAEQSASGLAVGLYTLVPGIVAWSSSSWQRAILLMAVATAASAGALAVGPASLLKVSVVCNEAAYLRIDSGNMECEVLHESSRWTPFWHSEEQALKAVQCVASDAKQSWSPQKSATTGTLQCGKRPRDPTVIESGISLEMLDIDTVSGQRTSRSIRGIRDHLSKTLPMRNVKDNLLVATWSLRDFGARQSPLKESLHYMAEIISHFDLVAIQEAKSDLALQELRSILGDNWGMVASAEAPGVMGNRERFAFLFDIRKVALGQAISSIVILGAKQLARPPYLVEFSIGGSSLLFCTVHIVWGNDEGERVIEIEALVSYLAKQQQRSERKDVILLGDFNARDANGQELAIVRNAGFVLDPDLQSLATNQTGSSPLDQIAVLSQSRKWQFGRVGVFNPFGYAFRTEQESDYKPEMGEGYNNAGDRSHFYATWRTYQISDHLLKWAEIRLVPDPLPEPSMTSSDASKTD